MRGGNCRVVFVENHGCGERAALAGNKAVDSNGAGYRQFPGRFYLCRRFKLPVCLHIVARVVYSALLPRSGCFNSETVNTDNVVILCALVAVVLNQVNFLFERAKVVLFAGVGEYLQHGRRRVKGDNPGLCQDFDLVGRYLPGGNDFVLHILFLF